MKRGWGHCISDILCIVLLVILVMKLMQYLVFEDKDYNKEYLQD